MQRYKFFDIFQRNTDGSLTPKRAISVNGITFGQGISFGKGVSFGGVNFFDYQHLDIAGEEQNGVLVIKGFYND